ncbi:hypothetical protein [Haladaptatus sp. AB643]|uniref:hypothetical protein n=1 Tax=Haladaptatus sp. AB643 TaxID=2934174 RepID=UPI00209BD868|nr:hypothetical protein [Haladaptatus sp. AB643]MCO8244756.1 hypothetical protein [Haladaptatus sp. AB643]
MSENPAPSTVKTDDRRTDSEHETADDSAVRLELLAEENRHLRAEYRRARRANYRRTALGMVGVGALSGLDALLFPASRTVFVALAGTGLFAAVLTYFLTPEQFVSASVGERTYAAHAATGAELVETLGLTGTEIYLPTGETAGPDAGVRLFVPHHHEYALPTPDDLSSPFVVTDDERERGMSMPSTGSELFVEFESMIDDTADRLPDLADQLADTLVEGFEMVEGATTDVEAEDGQVTVGIDGSRYGPVDRFDHPVASFIAVGLAREMDRPVLLDCTTSEDDRVDYLITCSLLDRE